MLTSGQPSLNPRLVKEADALVDAGYQVTVIYQYWNDWGTKHDDILLQQKKWNSIRVGGDPQLEPRRYLISKLIQHLSILLYQAFPFLGTSKWAISRGSYWLLKEAKKHPASLFIGHNLGALPACVYAARYHQAKSGFDAEDFHRNETTDYIDSKDYRIKSAIESKYFRYLNYLTVASPLIGEKYKMLFPYLYPQTILNVFDSSLRGKRTAEVGGILKLFWFSQTIGEGRGLENVIKALALLEIPVQLHLLGNCTAEIKNHFINLAIKATVNTDNIFFHSPIPADEIVDFASQFDIGLATEMSMPLNRDICLTNKIFTYISAGLAVLASNTTGQKKLLQNYESIGLIFDQSDHKDLATKIDNFSANRTLLEKAKLESYELGKKELNWKKERKKFLSIIEKQICS